MTDMREFVRDYLGEDYLPRYDALSDDERAEQDAKLRKSFAYQARQAAEARDNLFEALGLFRLLGWMDRQALRLLWWRKP